MGLPCLCAIPNCVLISRHGHEILASAKSADDEPESLGNLSRSSFCIGPFEGPYATGEIEGFWALSSGS